MPSHKRFNYNTLQEMLNEIEKVGVDIPLSEDTAVLGQPLKLGDRTIPNRIVLHPMEGCDGTADGRPGELTTRRYERFAAGGAGLIWFEATAVVHEGRANPRQLLLSKENMPSIRELRNRTVNGAVEKFGKDQKPYTVLQLTHSGRYSRPDSAPQPIVAAKNPHLDNKFDADSIRIISDSELDSLADRYADAAISAADAGFDAVDVKSCHGYLSSELLSARTREGNYGGSFQNRTRFLMSCVDRIARSTNGAIDIVIRLNAYDCLPQPYGWGADSSDCNLVDLDEPVRLVRQLVDRGVRLINISAGNPYHNPHIGRPYDVGSYDPPEHPLTGVERILKLGRGIQEAVPEAFVVGTGLSWLREFGVQCAAGGINNGWFTLAGFGRQAFAYPDFPSDSITGGCMDRKKCCIACGKCTEIMRYDGMTGCVVRDSDVYLPIYREVSKEKR
ncbi:flavin oxidoreductase/NADH oxidase [Candidatus Latescibacterota bacterium]